MVLRKDVFKSLFPFRSILTAEASPNYKRRGKYQRLRSDCSGLIAEPGDSKATVAAFGRRDSSAKHIWCKGGIDDGKRI